MDEYGLFDAPYLLQKQYFQASDDQDIIIDIGVNA